MFLANGGGIRLAVGSNLFAGFELWVLIFSTRHK